MGIKFWLLTMMIIVIFAREITSANVTVCHDICKKCKEKDKSKAICLASCPAADNPHGLCESSLKYIELIIGIVIGVVSCIIVIMGGLLCIRFHKKRKDRIPKQSARELRKFHNELDRLRPHAYTFLAILNNIRRQVREMYRAGNPDAALICGRSLSDLAKILMLLNRRDVPIIPPDWPRLLSWAERLLERSTILNPPVEPQMAQLIQFLQNPAAKPHDFYRTNDSTPLSTLKSRALDDVPLQDQSTFPHYHYGKTEWTQHWEFPQDVDNSRASSSHEDAWRSAQPMVKQNAWIDDDFCMVAFRPQDEIVTVL